MYLTALREKVSQGDIFQSLVYRYVYQETQASDPMIRSRLIRAMLLTYDCEYDKPEAAYVYMAELRLLEEISKSTRGNVRSRRVFNAFPLETSSLLLDEYYVDFRRILRFDKTVIAESDLASNRVISITDTSRLALQQQMSVFFGFERDTSPE